MTNQEELLTQALAGRYDIIRDIGSGGMATVYLAEDVKHHRKVAVKVLRPDIGVAVGAERFLREMELVATLSHPHILPLYDSGAADQVDDRVAAHAPIVRRMAFPLVGG
jgi:serine/threonine-protein kinase